MSQAAKRRQLGMNNILLRVIPLEQTLTQIQLAALEVQLNHQLHLSLNRKNHLLVRYDAALIGFEQVLALLYQLGITVRDSRWFRIKAAWYDFVDTNIASQAKERPKPCCNRIPKI